MVGGVDRRLLDPARDQLRRCSRAGQRAHGGAGQGACRRAGRPGRTSIGWRLVALAGVLLAALATPRGPLPNWALRAAQLPAATPSAPRPSPRHSSPPQHGPAPPNHPPRPSPAIAASPEPSATSLRARPMPQPAPHEAVRTTKRQRVRHAAAVPFAEEPAGLPADRRTHSAAPTRHQTQLADSHPEGVRLYLSVLLIYIGTVALGTSLGGLCLVALRRRQW
jgi:hypothetical protein